MQEIQGRRQLRRDFALRPHPQDKVCKQRLV